MPSPVEKAVWIVHSLSPAELQSLLTRLEPADSAALERALLQPLRVPLSDWRDAVREFQEQVKTAAGVVPFAFLRQVTPESLVPFLVNELPQTIAFVLAHAPVPMAAATLGQLPVELRGEVAARIWNAAPADAAILAAVSEELERQMAPVTLARLARAS
jgi:flagellar motor switch protein FliG